MTFFFFVSNFQLSSLLDIILRGLRLQDLSHYLPDSFLVLSDLLYPTWSLLTCPATSVAPSSRPYACCLPYILDPYENLRLLRPDSLTWHFPPLFWSILNFLCVSIYVTSLVVVLLSLTIGSLFCWIYSVTLSTLNNHFVTSGSSIFLTLKSTDSTTRSKLSELTHPMEWHRVHSAS